MAKNGFAPNVTTYNTLISIVCEHLQEKKAFKIFQEMEEANCKPDIQTYNPLLKMCCKQKKMKILSYLLDDMVKKDCNPDLGTYTLLVHGLCKAGKVDLACQFFEEMVEKKLIPKYETYILFLDEPWDIVDIITNIAAIFIDTQLNLSTWLHLTTPRLPFQNCSFSSNSETYSTSMPSICP